MKRRALKTRMSGLMDKLPLEQISIPEEELTKGLPENNLSNF